MTRVIVPEREGRETRGAPAGPSDALPVGMRPASPLPTIDGSLLDQASGGQQVIARQVEGGFDLHVVTPEAKQTWQKCRSEHWFSSWRRSIPACDKPFADAILANKVGEVRVRRRPSGQDI